MEVEEIKGVVEALIFAADKPISLQEIKEIFKEVDGQAIRENIGRLQKEYESQGRSFQIVEVAGGFRMSTRPQFGEWLKKFYKFRHRERLSQASLETLAIIAYKQPIIRAEIEAIRGVDVAGVLHSLLEKRLIRVMGRKKIIGRPLIYGTNNQFLEHFGLKSLSELPRIEELKEGKEEEKSPSKQVPMRDKEENRDEHERVATENQ